jgi:hypothetical protein
MTAKHRPEPRLPGAVVPPLTTDQPAAGTPDPLQLTRTPQEDPVPPPQTGALDMLVQAVRRHRVPRRTVTVRVREELADAAEVQAKRDHKSLQDLYDAALQQYLDPAVIRAVGGEVR